MASIVAAGIALALVAIAALPVTAHAQAGTDLARSAERLPWSRGSERFQRQWLVLGPVPAAGLTAETVATLAASRPGPGAAAPAGASGAPAYWTPRVSWNDVLDVSEGAPITTSAEPRVVFARFSVDRKTDGAAELSLGADTSVTIWVNGRPAGETPADDAFAADAHRLPVPLHAGVNDVLLRLDYRGAPCRLTVRVLEPGTATAPVAEFSPTLTTLPDGRIEVRAHAASASGAPVHVTASAAGGRVVAEIEAPRDQPLRLDPASWPDGAYDLRCTTTDAWGAPAIVYLSWFKGDAAAAARRLLARATAPAGGDDASLIEPMLADMVRARAGNDLAGGVTPAVAAQLWSPLMEFEELELERSGQGSRIHGGGFVRIAYRDDIDGSTQFCRAYLPPDYDPRRRWPVVVFLHGFNPANPTYPGWWSADQRHSDIAEKRGVIYLEPHGRGNSQYLTIGERDVLRSIEEARRRFSVDDDRVYLMGESMGGSGTWLIASRNPGLFAAIAPTFGGWDPRLAPLMGARLPTPANVFRQEQASSFREAESLLNVPIFVHHGDADASVPVDHSRYIVRQLQRWGYDIRYDEIPGRGHEELGVRDATVQWLLTHRRNDAPRHVRIRSTDLLGASAHWVHVQTFEEPMRLMTVDAEMVTPGRLRLDTDNVAAIRLDPPAALLDPAAPQTLEIVWNGERHDVRLSAGAAELSRTGTTTASPLKRPGLEGPISDLWRTPFAVVVGTASADPAMRARCREKADAFRAQWELWQHVSPRILDDRAVTSADEKNYSLLLIGGAEANLVSRRLGDRIPLAVTADGFEVAGRHYAAKDAVAQVIYPSPFQADRYVMEVAATSANGLYFWNPISWNNPYGFPSVLWDWTIQDGRRVVLGPDDATEDAWIAAGMFDAAWRRDDRWSVRGNEKLRQQSPLRSAPSPDHPVAPEKLARLCGRYEIVPGIEIVVTKSAAGLAMSIVGGPPIPLVAEGETDFALANATPVHFSVEASKVTGVQILNDGRPTDARRID